MYCQHIVLSKKWLNFTWDFFNQIIWFKSMGISIGVFIPIFIRWTLFGMNKCQHTDFKSNFACFFTVWQTHMFHFCIFSVVYILCFRFSFKKKEQHINEKTQNTNHTKNKKKENICLPNTCRNIEPFETGNLVFHSSFL